MFSRKHIGQDFRQLGWFLLLPFILGLFLTSCYDSPIDATAETSLGDTTIVNNNIKFVPDKFDAVGTIQGTVVDKATAEALSEVVLALNFKPKEAEEPSVLTDTTGPEGTFSFTGVPVNTDASGNKGANSPYTLKINTAQLDNYRDTYRVNVNLNFEGTGGDGAATHLVSDVTIPLSEQAVKLKGTAHTPKGAVLAGVQVELYQKFNPIINGSSNTQTNMLVDSATTDGNGNFKFTGVEEKANVWLRFIDESDPTKVINYEYTNIDETPAADGTVPVMDLGVINVQSSNETGAFYITKVTPAPGSDISSVDTSFVYHFNRSVERNPYTRADLGFGNGTFKDDISFSNQGPKKAPGDVEFSVSWVDNRKALVITPTGLEDAHEYELNMAALNNSEFVDEFGNTLDFSASPYDSSKVVTLSFSTNLNNSKPHTPQVTASKASDIDYNNGDATLSWNVDESSAEVKEYEIWEKTGEGAYELLTVVDRDVATFGEISGFTYASVSSYSDPLVLLGGTGGDIPHDSLKKTIKVRAISKNLREGNFSNEITFADSIKPDVTGATYPGGDTLTVSFEEPLIKSQVEDTTHYTFEDSQGNDITDSINFKDLEYKADYGSTTSNEVYQAIIVVQDTSSLSSGQTVIVDSSVSDLATNGMDTNDSKNDNDGNENEATY